MNKDGATDDHKDNYTPDPLRVGVKASGTGHLRRVLKLRRTEKSKSDRGRASVELVAVNYAPEVTGIGPYVTSLAQGLETREWSVRVITGYPHYPQWERLGAKGDYQPITRDGHVEVRRVRHIVPNGRSLISRLFLEVTFGLNALLSGPTRGAAAVIVSPPLITAAIITTANRVFRWYPKTIIWVQDIYALGVQETGSAGGTVAAILRRVESYVLRSADVVVVPHPRFATYCSSQLGVSEDRLQLVRNWRQADVRVSQSEKAQARARFGWPGDALVVLHAGNMGAKQGLENVVHAARCADELAAPVHFVLVGDGNQRDVLEVAASGITRLSIVDTLNDADFSRALSGADILLVNEKVGIKEMAVPSKLTTYFSTGLPVIAAVAADGITASEIRAAGAGLVVTPGSPRELLDEALDLGVDLERCRAYGSSAQQYAADELSDDAGIDRFDAALAGLLRIDAQ